MTSVVNTRFAVLPSLLVVPSQEEVEARFRAFFLRMRRDRLGADKPIKLNFSEERKLKSLAEDAWSRRMRVAGLTSIKKPALAAISGLAREGGRLVGPASEHEVHQLAAKLHAESGWMREVSTWVMNEMLRHVASGERGVRCRRSSLPGHPASGNRIMPALSHAFSTRRSA
ncbi:hypothetical protein [Pseudogemmobacter humi]|uniref:Uncharacterized protein n=1 Tax=Pseudogemmobacter humi TaxID=2483812 RepID=A0A3P5WEU6_9RHOB|nr:hypothetical protein [Pseudogemmobacter humi]VDC19049.1 hypothetical protein XINFAN_00049 [Pseudogemmobacter humi]